MDFCSERWIDRPTRRPDMKWDEIDILRDEVDNLKARPGN
jgi:hypothetical protein